MTKYPVTIHGELGAYGVLVPDMEPLGVCCAMGATVDEALENAVEALADFVECAQEHGQVIPGPSPIEDISLEPGWMVAYIPLRISVAV